MENYPNANVVGSIMYAVISTKPDLAYPISDLSKYMANPGIDHWLTIKWVISYIVGSLEVGLCYNRRHASLDLLRYIAGDRNTRKSTTTYIFKMAGNCIHWSACG